MLGVDVAVRQQSADDASGGGTQAGAAVVVAVLVGAGAKTGVLDSGTRVREAAGIPGLGQDGGGAKGGRPGRVRVMGVASTPGSERHDRVPREFLALEFGEPIGVGVDAQGRAERQRAHWVIGGGEGALPVAGEQVAKALPGGGGGLELLIALDDQVPQSRQGPSGR